MRDNFADIWDEIIRQTKRRHSWYNFYTYSQMWKRRPTKNNTRNLLRRELIYKQSNLTKKNLQVSWNSKCFSYSKGSIVYIKDLYIFECYTITHLGWANEALLLHLKDVEKHWRQFVVLVFVHFWNYQHFIIYGFYFRCGMAKSRLTLSC